MAQRQAKKKVRTRRATGGKRPRPTARVAVTVDRTLLAQAERFARQSGISLAELVAEGLRRVTGPKAPVLPPGPVVEETNAAPGLEQLLGWMAQQQEALTEIRNALGDVAAALPNDARPAPQPQAPRRIPPL